MNILVDPFPDTVQIHGVDYRIQTDFRASLLTIMAFEDPTLVWIEKQGVMLQNLFIDVPEDIEEAVQQAQWFLNGGRSLDDDDKDLPRVYSFDKDAELIFAAFNQTHNINLETATLHWWRFLALFMDLGSETAFCNLAALRKRVKTGKATKEEKQMAHDMGDRFTLPDLDTRTIEEKERERLFFEASKKRRANGKKATTK